ncbi:Oxysterol-binding protein-related protein 1B [Coccomyxa sp. Obi]|nr:Oxysterol-binding protein-related protein 1B [Coccomyxa sp. Obi]
MACLDNDYYDDQGALGFKKHSGHGQGIIQTVSETEEPLIGAFRASDAGTTKQQQGCRGDTHWGHSGTMPSHQLPDKTVPTAPHPASIQTIDAWLQVEPAHERRQALPPPKQPAPTAMNVWSLIKDVVGKGELSRVQTPVQFLEPLSELQQRCEDMEFSELLDRAAASERCSLERLLLVTAFAVSAYSGVKRTCKPFNALLGETYELACPEKGFRFISEKVQHDPTTINHVFAEGRGWTFELEDELHTRFTGTAIELAPLVLLQVAFSDGDTYRWGKAVTSINNVIVGRVHLEHKGSWRLRGLQSGLTACMKFHATTLLSSKSKLHEVSGVVEKGGQLMKGVKLRGKWDSELHADLPDSSSRLLWRVNPPAADPSRYCMTPWVLRLNDMTPQLAGRLPPTDTRLRPDVRALEAGIYDQAALHYKRLEEEQAARLATSAKTGAAHEPHWFERVRNGGKIGEEYLFRYRGGYWETRAAGAFADQE